LFEFVNHGGRWGNTAQALARWRHPVASSEALDLLHRALRPALYRCIAIAIEIVVDLPAFFCLVNFVVGHNHKLKTISWSI
jgi:hypothetical protein